MSSGSSPDVIVIGGGVIGLSVAWRARERGMSVTVLEREEIGRGTSHVAAGMLAPVAEVEFGAAGRHLLEMGLRSVAVYSECDRRALHAWRGASRRRLRAWQTD